MTDTRFKSIFNNLSSGQMVVPWLESALLSDTWPESYSIEIDSGEYYGKGDGYFHPSTHPLMGARELYYRFHPDTKGLVIQERKSLQSHMTLAMGSALHGVVQTQLQMAGLLSPEDVEVEYVNHEHHVRGRIDFILNHPSGERVLVEMKSLACSTPILTTAGWSTMGNLRDGDEVYAPDGQPTKVIKAHPINLSRPCYRVKFRDGQSIVADAEHLWSVSDRGKDRVMTTKEISESNWYGMYRFRVPVTEPIQMPEQELPIDPWLLGMWLGDGDSSMPSITVGESDLDFVWSRLNRLGLTHKMHHYDSKKTPKVYVHGQRGIFSALGLLNHPRTGNTGTKHIPEQYLLGSENQRRELLAGLMDSDGTVGDHQAAICMVNEPLMRQVLQLVRSLGYRATWNESRAKLDGRDCGPVYWVKFSTSWGLSPFSMPRKKQKWDAKPKSDKRVRTNAIVSIVEVDTVPVRCITVAHESSLYVAGLGFVPTHNTQNSFAFKKQEVVKPSWDAQLSLAMDSKGFDYGILLVMESGFPYSFREFRVARNDSLLSEIYAKFDMVRSCIAMNTPPKYCCSLGSKEMENCSSRFLCWLANEQV